MFCAKCQRFWSEAVARAQVPGLIASCEDIRWSSYEANLHSNLRELKLASDSRCILCRIIYHTPTEFEHERLLRDDYEPLHIVLNIDPSKGPHPVLSVTFREISGNGTRIPKRMVAACGGLLNDGACIHCPKLFSNLKAEKTTATLRRSVELTNDSTGSDGALHLAASWVETCVREHESCRAPLPPGISSFVPTRLLDVSRNAVRLVETKTDMSANMDRRYIALSHCWGKISIICTRKENYETHLSRIDPVVLSKTFEDAVHTTRMLGLRYLWIDSLCIIQDDKNDWATEAATMCDVYQNATLTIAAAHAAGGDVGCFEKRDGLLHMPLIVDVPPSVESRQPSRVVFTSYGRSKGLGGPEPPLYGRAWVLQEQLLSPRMLVFDGSQLRWECLTMHASERSHLGGMSRHAGHQKAIRKGIMTNEEFFSNAEFDDRDFSARTQHLYWCYNVMDYTHRGMTQMKDRLVALAGTAQALNRRTESEYHAGLWSRFFWAGMLWSIPHTREYIPTTTDAFNLEDNKHIRHAQPIAPSWSWASVTAPVVYASPTLVSLDPICDVLNATTSGTAAVQTGRATIRGHTRKGYVNAVYPFAIREATESKLSHMMTQKPEGQVDLINFKGHAFPPNDNFLFSNKRPTMARAWRSDLHPTLQYTKYWDWRLVRGTFRPDQIIPCDTEITFLAIAQQHVGHKSPSLLETHGPDDPLRVYTIALVPTGETASEYKRVGYAVWSDCAWYGYMCSHKQQSGAGRERPGSWTKEHGWEVDNSVLGTLRWWMKWDDRELYKREKKATHAHEYEADALPDLKRYNKDVSIEEKVVVIV
jgi:hypothetical protein